MSRRRQSSFIDRILDRVADAVTDFAGDLIEDLEKELPRIQAQGGIPNFPGAGAGASGGPRRKGSRKGQNRPQTAPPPPKGPTAYDSLEVSPRASQETIEAAFKSLARRYHPDVSKHKEAGERMRQINVAYEILSDKEKRKKYDKSIGL